MSGRYFSSYDGKTVMADVDVNGNSLELTIEDEKVKAIGNIPVGGGDESVWTDETFNALSDDEGDDILDENGEAIGDEDAETLWATRDGVGFKAKRAEADINGNSLELHVNTEGKVDKIGDKYIAGTGEAPVDAYSKEETDALLADKQDNLTFDGTYDATTNPAATVATVESALPSNLPAAKDGADASLVTTGNKYDWDDWKSSNITIPLPKDTIEVKGHLFKYVQIGKLLVTTENLDIPLGTVGTNCFWFKDDPDTYGDYGMYYKFSALGTFEYKDYYHPNEFVPTQEVYDCIYSQGWRIWTETDFNNLAQAHGQQTSQDNYKAMCSTTGWKNNPQGTNELGFNAMPTGERNWNASDSSGYSDDGYYFCIRVIKTTKRITRISPSYWLTDVGDLNTGASIRLVKDVTV